MATTLAISHNIFLSREQRYALHAGQEIQVVGVSVPVWYFNGITSEPAVEVFVRYTLRNKPESIYLTHNNEGYEISLPPCQQKLLDALPKNVWIPLSQEKQSILLMDDAPCLDSLLDIKEGGDEYMQFRQFTKVSKGNKVLNVVHFVEIKKLEDLLDTLC